MTAWPRRVDPAQGDRAGTGADGASPACRAPLRTLPPGARAPGIVSVALLLALGACAGFDEVGRPSLDTVATRMPAQIAGFVLGETTERPGPVLSLDYATANRSAVATVLIYGTGGRAVPSDPNAPEIERELSSAVSEVSEAPSGRTGRRLAEQERITIADPGLRCSVMTGAFGRAPVTRHVCIGGAQGRFVKVQVTMGSAGTRGAADPLAFAAGALRAARGD